MGNGSKIKQHKRVFLKGQGWMLLCRQLCISFCSSLASPDAHGCKWSWGGGRTIQFEQGWDKKNIEEDNGFSAGPLNLTWTLPCREMRTKTIFHDQLHGHLSNKWWLKVNRFVSGTSTAAYTSWHPRAENRGGEEALLMVCTSAYWAPAIWQWWEKWRWRPRRELLFQCWVEPAIEQMSLSSFTSYGSRPV